MDNFSPVNAALGDVCTKAFVSNNGENYDASSIEKDYKENAEEINIITLDSMVLNDDADYFLKMDVEGSELKALRGGVNFIKNKHIGKSGEFDLTPHILNSSGKIPRGR